MKNNKSNYTKTGATCSDSDYMKAGATRPRIKVGLINQAIAFFYQVDIEDLLSKTRDYNCLRARHVAWYLARVLANKNYSHIGMIFERDHSTVMEGINNLLKEMQTDTLLRSEIGMLGEMIKTISARPTISRLKQKTKIKAKTKTETQSDRIEKKIDRLTKIIESWNAG
jgi:hypothetical protein